MYLVGITIAALNSLFCVSPGNLEYRTIDEPVSGSDQVVLKIKRIGICGTDLHAYEGTQPYFNYPRILGHELAGEIVSGTLPNGFSIGDHVTFIPYFHCGTCIACRKGQPNCCVQMKVCGVHVDGGMVDYLAVPSASLLAADGLSDDALALTEPLAIGAHALRRAAITKEEFVLVIGAGPIGSGIVALAKASGAQVIVMDINTHRLNFCKTSLQADHIVNALEDPIGTIREITRGDFPTVVIDATGNASAIMKGFDLMAHSGRYILVGLQKGPLQFSHPEFHKRESTLMSSRNATREDFLLVMEMLRRGSVRPADFITHRTSFDQIKNEFPRWLDPASEVIKAMVCMD